MFFYHCKNTFLKLQMTILPTYNKVFLKKAPLIEISPYAIGTVIVYKKQVSNKQFHNTHLHY